MVCSLQLLIQWSQAMEVEVDKFFDRLNIPVYQCARFYGFYYLYAIKDMDDKEKVVRNAASIQKKAFKHYGRYAVAGELSNVDKGVYFYRDKIARILRENTTESIIRRMDDAWYEFIYGDPRKDPYINGKVKLREFFDIISPSIPNEVAFEIVEQHIEYDARKYLLDAYIKSNNQINFGQLMWELLEELTYAADRPRNPSRPQVEIFVDEFRAVSIFEGDKFYPAAKTIFEGLNWYSAFGGDAWYSISSVLGGIDEYSEITAVDMLWGLQHNNNLWMDKIALSGKDNYLVKSGKELRNHYNDMLPEASSEIFKLAPPNPENPRNYVAEEVLQAFLDVRQAGEFYKAWPYITNVRGLSEYEHIFKIAGR